MPEQKDRGRGKELRQNKGKGRRRITNACQTQALTGCLVCFMQVPYSGETHWKIVLLSKNLVQVFCT